ncbi:MAG: thiamine phosphate synthase [Flavobacteriales bacterium]|nr:thiamine phosphate synthase [Flavobacteriales bacterium]
MKLIVISSPNKSHSEIRHVIDFFENGLEVFHVKKQGFSRAKMKEYLDMIPRKYRDRIVLHSHFYLAPRYKLRGIHLSKRKSSDSLLNTFHYIYARLFTRHLKMSKSFHSIQSLMSDTGNYDYVLLSPVFDKHEMQIFSAAFGEKQLRNTLFKTKHKVIALGGITEDRIDIARRTGFYGVALHGLIWKEKANRLGKFIEIRDRVVRATANIS